MAHSYYTVDKVIRELLFLKMGEDSTHKYERLLPHAYDFLDKFKTDASRQFKTVELEIDNQRIAFLPEDFAKETKVGIQVGNRILLLAPDSSIPNLDSDTLLDSASVIHLDQTGNRIMPVGSFSLHTHWSKDTPYHYLGWKGDLIGWGEDWNETFSIDRGSRLIRFSSNIRARKLYLEYLSFDHEIHGETPINPLCKPAMESYILWRYYLMRKDPIFQVHKQDYEREYMRLGGLLDPWNIQSIYKTMYDNYSLNP